MEFSNTGEHTAYSPIAQTIRLDYTRGAGGPKGLVSNHLKSVWIRGNEEDGGNILKRMDDARFSLFDSDYEIKSSKVVIFF